MAKLRTQLKSIKQMSEKEVRKELREFRKSLAVLCEAVETFSRLLDAEMRKPSTVERGKRVAALLNHLEWANDHAILFTLRSKCGNGANRSTTCESVPVSPEIQEKVAEILRKRGFPAYQRETQLVDVTAR